MKNTVGQPVRGGDFFDREPEQRTLWDSLDADNILLLAPRRVGKTSLMRRLEETAEQQGFRALYLTVEGATDEPTFVRRLLEAVHTADSNLVQHWIDGLAQSRLGKLVKRTKKVEAAGWSVELADQVREHWAELGATLARFLEKADGRWLLQVDEIPVFLLKLLAAKDGPRRAEEFLHWLRQVRQTAPHVRWLLAGSIGLDTVAARLNLGDTINDLRMQGLGPFDSETAGRFLLELSKSYPVNFAPQIREYIVERVAWPIPYYLQVVFAELREMNGASSIDRNRVDEAFARLLDPARKNYFDYWRQRLHDELGTPEDGWALTLLNSICRDPEGASYETLQQVLARRISDPDERDTHLRYLLDVLQNDGYLVEDGDRYRFRLPLLREYWLKRVAR